MLPYLHLSTACESKGGDDDEQKTRKPSEARVVASLKKRLSKNTRKLLLRSCSDSKFFSELESTLISFKVRIGLLMQDENDWVFQMKQKIDEPTTFQNPKFSGIQSETMTVVGFDSYQRFLLHRIAKFHDLRAKSENWTTTVLSIWKHGI